MPDVPAPNTPLWDEITRLRQQVMALENAGMEAAAQLAEAEHAYMLCIELKDEARAEIERLREVIRRLLYHAGPITPETPCRCGAAQPAHYCDYAMQAERDALKLVPDA